MLRIIYFVISFFICSNLMAQIESDEYFEILLTVKKESHRIQYIGNGNFVINPIDLSQQAFLMDTLGNRIDLPCNKLKRKKSKDSSDILYCYQDTLVGLFSVSKHQFVTSKYESVHLINENFYAIQKEEKACLYNMDHKLLLELDTYEDLDRIYKPCGSNHANIFYENNRLVVNYMGEIVDNYPLSPNSNSFSGGVYYFIENGKYGLKSALGEEIIPAKYEYVKEWQHNQYIVGLRISFSPDKNSVRPNSMTLKGVFDISKKKFVLPLEYEYIHPYEYGLICRKPNCKTTLLNKSFENVYKKEFNSIKGSKNGFVLLKNDFGTYYDFVYDSLGWVLKDDIETGSALTDQVSKAKFKNGNYVLVNRLGKVVFDSNGENVSYKRLNDNYIEFKKERKTGVLNELGNWLVEPGDNRFTTYHELGGLLVENYTKKTSNLFSSTGQKIATGVKHSSIIYPKNGYILSKEKKLGVIDDEGNILIPFNFQRRIQEFREMAGFYFINDGEYAYLVKIKKR